MCIVTCKRDPRDNMKSNSTKGEARRWANYFQVFKKCGVASVTTWGIQRNLVDEDFFLKPNFWTILNPALLDDAASEYEN